MTISPTQQRAYPFIVVETQAPRRPANAPAGERRGFEVPVLRARPGHLAGTVGRSLRERGVHPVVVFLTLILAGLFCCSVLSICAGILVTHVLEHVAGIGPADERANTWLAAHRTGSLTEASLVGSTVGGGVVLPIVAGSFALVCFVLRKWRIGAFLIFALGVESATYRITTLVVHSHRPRVVRLEQLPVNASYPSGHTAASIAVYSGLALLLTSRSSNARLRVLVWALATLFTIFVALSRMYRGMHHPLDVGGGLVVGVAALVAVVFACRAADAAARDARSRRT